LNSRGLFCFTLVLAFSAGYFSLANSSEETFAELQKGKSLAFEAEKSSLLKHSVEANLDFLIAKAIEEETKKGNLDAEKLNEKIAGKIFNYFNELEKQQGFEKIEFFEGNYSKNNYEKILKGKRNKKLGLVFLLENSRVLVLNLEEKVYLVEFSFTGGIFKNKVGYAVISTPNTRDYFLLPVNYSHKTMVVK